MALMVVDWIGSATIGMLVEKVSSYLSQAEELRLDVAKELLRLENELCHFKSVLMVVENHKNKLHVGVGNNNALERWTWELRDAVEEAEDVVDDIEYYQIEKQVTANRVADNKVLADFSGATYRATDDKVLARFSRIKRKFSELIQKYRASSSNENDAMLVDKLRGAIHKLDTVKTNAKCLVDIVNVPTALATDNPPLQNDQNASNPETGHMLTVDKIFGRDQDKEYILEWLMKSDCNKNASALTIWGIGGLGKTTLCQAIYNDGNIKEHFQVRMWICVSNQFDAAKQLLTKAIESATNGSAPATKTITVLQQKLQKIVFKKKFLLVLDDVWDGGDSTSWVNFVTPLKDGERGSKILITTRQEYIGTLILSQKELSIGTVNYKLDGLGENDSTKLFNTHAFVGVNTDAYSDLRKIGNEIIKKCGGLPLFLKMMGGLLRTNLNYSYWERVWKYDVLHLEDGINEAFDILKISYQHLPPNLQACFRFCSIYPQDYCFKRNDLVQLWVGAGLIQQFGNDKRQIEEIGEEYLDGLQARSFFELQDNGFSNEKYYIIHDLLHELAKAISEGECMEVIGNKFNHIPTTLRHLSICETNLNVLNHLSNLQNLRTLIINCQGMPPELTHVLTRVLMQLKKLRVLSLRYLPAVASLDVVKHLKHLRYLDCKILSDKNHWFPTIYPLYHLQFLSCSYSYSEHNCPADGINVEGIDKLIKLRHLNLPESILIRIKQIQHLTELREVKCYIKNDSGIKISKLKNLNKLHKLCIAGLNLTTPAEAKEIHLHSKEHLQELSLSWENEIHQKDFEFYEKVVDHLQPHRHIKIFNLENFGGKRAPCWMTKHYLSSIVSIELRNCCNMEHLPPLCQMPFLKYHKMIVMPGIKQIGMDFYPGGHKFIGFPSLEQLIVRDMEYLEEWRGADNADWFPHLKELQIVNCSKLKDLPSVPLSLKKLQLDNVGLTASPQWQEDMLSSSSSMTPKQIHAPALEKLHLRKLASTRSLPQIQVFSTFTSLDTITLVDLESLTCIGGLRGLISLRYLLIKGCNNLSLGGAAAPTHLDSSFRLLYLEIDDVALLQIDPLSCITSARWLWINGDRKIESLAAVEQWLLQNAASLEAFMLSETMSLCFLPPTFKSLCSSIGTLSISNCPLVDSLPDMPTSLKTLWIFNCPLVKERYHRDFGPDWHHISHILYVFFDGKMLTTLSGSTFLI